MWSGSLRVLWNRSNTVNGMRFDSFAQDVYSSLMFYKVYKCPDCLNERG